MILRLLLCRWLSRHRPAAGVNPAWSITWVCERCGQLVPGDIVRRKKAQ